MLTSSRGVADDSPDFESGIWAGRIVSPRDGGINTFSKKSLQMLKPRIRVHLPQEAMKDRIHGTWAYARSQVSEVYECMNGLWPQKAAYSPASIKRRKDCSH